MTPCRNPETLSRGSGIDLVLNSRIPLASGIGKIGHLPTCGSITLLHKDTVAGGDSIGSLKMNRCEAVSQSSRHSTVRRPRSTNCITRLRWCADSVLYFFRILWKCRSSPIKQPAVVDYTMIQLPRSDLGRTLDNVPHRESTLLAR